MRTCSSDSAISETSWSLCSGCVCLLAFALVSEEDGETYVRRRISLALHLIQRCEKRTSEAGGRVIVVGRFVDSKIQGGARVSLALAWRY